MYVCGWKDVEENRRLREREEPMTNDGGDVGLGFESV